MNAFAYRYEVSSWICSLVWTYIQYTYVASSFCFLDNPLWIATCDILAAKFTLSKLIKTQSNIHNLGFRKFPLSRRALSALFALFKRPVLSVPSFILVIYLRSRSLSCFAAHMRWTKQKHKLAFGRVPMHKHPVIYPLIWTKTKYYSSNSIVYCGKLN